MNFIIPNKINTLLYADFDVCCPNYCPNGTVCRKDAGTSPMCVSGFAAFDWTGPTAVLHLPFDNNCYIEDTYLENGKVRMPKLKMLYLIGPDGLVNRGFINFRKMHGRDGKSNGNRLQTSSTVSVHMNEEVTFGDFRGRKQDLLSQFYQSACRWQSFFPSIIQVRIWHLTRTSCQWHHIT